MPGKTQTSMRNKKIIIPVIILLVVAASLFAWWRMQQPQQVATTDTPPANEVKTDLSPATEEEKQEANEQKEKLVDREKQTPTTTPGTKTAVTPVIVDAGQYDQIEVRAFVPNIIEDGGQCVITFSKGSTTFTKTVSGQRDATTTRCANLNVDRSEFAAAGTWSVAVAYSSSAAQGTSPTKTFEVR